MGSMWVGLAIAAVVVALIVRRDILEAKAPPNPDLVCPHCQVRGQVKAMRAVRKRGISGGKATGAVMTGGLSLFATGLSRKQRVAELHCLNCGIRWDVS